VVEMVAVPSRQPKKAAAPPLTIWTTIFRSRPAFAA
jgi:hypothetical protein